MTNRNQLLWRERVEERGGPLHPSRIRLLRSKMIIAHRPRLIAQLPSKDRAILRIRQPTQRVDSRDEAAYRILSEPNRAWRRVELARPFLIGIPIGGRIDRPLPKIVRIRPMLLELVPVPAQVR